MLHACFHPRKSQGTVRSHNCKHECRVYGSLSDRHGVRIRDCKGLSQFCMLPSTVSFATSSVVNMDKGRVLGTAHRALGTLTLARLD